MLSTLAWIRAWAVTSMALLTLHSYPCVKPDLLKQVLRLLPWPCQPAAAPAHGKVLVRMSGVVSDGGCVVLHGDGDLATRPRHADHAPIHVHGSAHAIIILLGMLNVCGNTVSDAVIGMLETRYLVTPLKCYRPCLHCPDYAMHGPVG